MATVFLANRLLCPQGLQLRTDVRTRRERTRDDLAPHQMNIVEPLTPLTIFSANRARLIGYLRSLGATNDAEDLAHEVWLRLDRLESTERVTTSYIMRIAHNLVIDQARAARQRRLREEAYHTDGPGVDDIDQAPNAERMLLSRERLNRLQIALAKLGPRTEEIFRRHRLEGVPQRLLADELGISISAIEKQLQKAYRLVASIQFEQEETL